jgi:hypothetical protein
LRGPAAAYPTDLVEGDTFYSISILLTFYFWTFQVAYSKPKLKINGIKAYLVSDHAEQEIYQVFNYTDFAIGFN